MVLFLNGFANSGTVEIISVFTNPLFKPGSCFRSRFLLSHARKSAKFCRKNRGNQRFHMPPKEHRYHTNNQQVLELTTGPQEWQLLM